MKFRDKFKTKFKTNLAKKGIALSPEQENAINHICDAVCDGTRAVVGGIAYAGALFTQMMG